MRASNVYNLSVCVTCIQVLVNGEVNDGTDRGEVAAAAMVDRWGDGARHIVPVGNSLDFSREECDGCGDRAHGERFAADLITPRR